MMESSLRRGFTLVELLLVMSLTIVIGAFVMSVDMSTARAFRVSSDTEAALTLLRDAQHEAAHARFGSGSGVYIEEDMLVAYVGDSYEARDQDRDRELTLSTDINAELPLDIHFTHPTGETDERHELLFTDGVHKRTVIIEQSGLAYFAP